MFIREKLPAEKPQSTPRGGLRPGTDGLGTCEKVPEAPHPCNALHFIGRMETLGQLWNYEIFLVRKCPCKKKPLKLSHWHQPVLCGLIQTSWASSLLKGGGNKPGVTTVQSSLPCCEWGIVEEFLIEQCACANPPFIHPTGKFRVS